MNIFYNYHSNRPPETTYVQLVDASDKNLINNLISRSINKEGNKKFQFNVNAIVYLYDETSTDTFAYIQAIHRELLNTFKDFLGNNANLGFMLCNMIGATGGSKNSEEESMTMLKMAENFLEKFNENIQVNFYLLLLY